MLNAPWLTLLAVGVAYLVSLPVSMVVAWRLRRQHAREAEQAAAIELAQEDRAERVVRLGPGAKPPKRDAS